MKKSSFFKSLPFKLLVGVVIGILAGLALNANDGTGLTNAILNIIVTLKYVLGQIISFCVPLIIIGFIAPSITKMGNNASRLLLLAVCIAYVSSVGAALFSTAAGYALIPHLSIVTDVDGLKELLEMVFELSIPQIMPVMSALVFSIMIGLAAAWNKAKLITGMLEEFQKIVLSIVSRILIPILPLFIGFTFCSLAYEGSITKQLPVFLKVIIIVMIGHYIWMALLYTIAGVYSGKNPLTYAELTAAMPQCGGEHVFSYRAMGSTGSFICTWMIVLGYVSVACFEACAFPTIITYLWPGFLKGYMYTVAGFDIYASWLITAIVIAFLIMMINIIGAKTAAILQTVLTCIIGGAGILLIVASVINGTVDNLDGQIFAGTTAGVNIKAIIGVAAMSPFYFIGFDVIPQAAEEINVPPKKIGNILILSVVLAVIFYAFVIIAVGFVMNPGDIIASQEATGLVTADAMAAAFNTKIMAKVIIVGGMCGIVTSWNSFLLGGSRAMYSMAESYMIPKFFAKLHPKHKTPVNALILIGILTMLAPFAGRKMLVWISDAGNFGCCFAYCMVALSFMILRKKEPDMPRPYKVPCYKFFGTMAVIMSGFMVAMYCIPGSGGNLILQEWLMVLGWSALGVVFYVVCKVKYKESFGTLVEIISDEDAATLMPEADEEELDKVIDAAIDRVLMQKSDLIGGTV